MSGGVRARAVLSVFVALVCGAVCTDAGAQSLDDLFNDAALQDVHLRVSQRDWDALTERSDQDTSYPADLVWNGITVRNVAIRHRGFGTRSSAKPNLRVDFNRYLSDLPIDYLLANNVFTRRAMAVPSVRLEYLSALQECAGYMAEPGGDGDRRGWMEREIERVANQIAPSVAADSVALFTFEQFQAEVSLLMDFARARPSFVQCQAVAAGAPGGGPCAATSLRLRR